MWVLYIVWRSLQMFKCSYILSLCLHKWNEIPIEQKSKKFDSERKKKFLKNCTLFNNLRHNFAPFCVLLYSYVCHCFILSVMFPDVKQCSLMYNFTTISRYVPWKVIYFQWHIFCTAAHCSMRNLVCQTRFQRTTEISSLNKIVGAT